MKHPELSYSREPLGGGLRGEDVIGPHSWSPLSGLKGVNPPLQFGERTRDCSPGHALEKPADSTHSSKCGLSPREQLERQVKLHSFTQDEALPSWPNSSGTLRSESEMATRLPHPWDSPGKNTGVGCHFLLLSIPTQRLNCVGICGGASPRHSCVPSSPTGLSPASRLQRLTFSPSPGYF